MLENSSPPPQTQHRMDGIPYRGDENPFLFNATRTPPPLPSNKPTKLARVHPMNLPLFIGGVQSAPKGATPPPTGGILDKLSSSMDGMMIPLLIGGGVLLIILILHAVFPAQLFLLYAMITFL